MTRFVLFDLDGTLVDTLADITAATNAGLGAIGRPPLAPEKVNRMIGRGLDVLLLLATGGTPTEEERRLARAAFDLHYDAHLLDATRAIPGAEGTLADLAVRSARIGVLSNKPVNYSEKILAGLDLRRYLDVVTGPPEVAPKPDPEGVRLVARRWGIGEREILFVGDSEVDRETAARAGCFFLHVPKGVREKIG